MIKRFIYWLTHSHKKVCKHCCLFCKFYEYCKDDREIGDIPDEVN